MITLALAQMVYFLSVSAERYGSDDGLNIYARSDFGIDFFSLENNLTMYYTIFAVLLASTFVVWRLANSRFGLVIRATKSNEIRLEAVGISAFRHRLVAFVIAGVMCGVAGLLQANFERFVSPDMMNWPRSGELIFMVVLGGMHFLFGPVIGAFVFLISQRSLRRSPFTGTSFSDRSSFSLCSLRAAASPASLTDEAPVTDQLPDPCLEVRGLRKSLAV